MKKLLSTFALAAQCALAPMASSAQTRDQTPLERTSLVFETVSHHFDDYAYNEFNPGIGAEYRLNDHFHAGAGVYKNSINATSLYAAAGVETNSARFFGLGFEAGIVSGYNETVIPSAMPYLRIGRRTDTANLKINVLPPVKDVTPAVLALQVRINIKKNFKIK